MKFPSKLHQAQTTTMPKGGTLESLARLMGCYGNPMSYKFAQPQRHSALSHVIRSAGFSPLGSQALGDARSQSKPRSNDRGPSPSPWNSRAFIPERHKQPAKHGTGSLVQGRPDNESPGTLVETPSMSKGSPSPLPLSTIAVLEVPRHGVLEPAQMPLPRDGFDETFVSGVTVNGRDTIATWLLRDLQSSNISRDQICSLYTSSMNTARALLVHIHFSGSLVSGVFHLI